MNAFFLPPLLKELGFYFWGKLPLWVKAVLLFVPVLFLFLLLLLFAGVLLGSVWIVFSFINSGVWKSLPSEVAASIVAGLFAVISLIIGNSFNKKNEVEAAIKIKQIERQEVERYRKTEFYSEVINKVTSLVSKTIKIDEDMNSFYGKLYTQGSPEVITSFLKLARDLEVSSSDKNVIETSIYPQANILISKIRRELGLPISEESQLYKVSFVDRVQERQQTIEEN